MFLLTIKLDYCIIFTLFFVVDCWLSLLGNKILSENCLFKTLKVRKNFPDNILLLFIKTVHIVRKRYLLYYSRTPCTTLQDTLEYTKTSYINLGHPIILQDTLFYSRTLYVTLGHSIVIQDTLQYSRTFYITLGHPVVLQETLCYVTLRHFYLSRTPCSIIGHPILLQNILQ